VSRRTTYLLHFIDPETGQAARYKHAGHYIGDTEKGREDGRREEHREGRGAVLTAAARRAGLDFVITRTWPGGASKARQLKTRSGALYCPECSEHPEPGTRPRRPGAKYLTRRQREAAKRDREARQAMEETCRQTGAYASPWPGQPLPACPGCERGGQAHNTECDERERAVARLLADIGAEPREETGMAKPEGPLTGPELDEEIGRLAEQYPEPADEMAQLREARDEAAAKLHGPFDRYAQGAENDVDARQAWYDAVHAYRMADLDFMEADAAQAEGAQPDHLYGAPACTEADPETEHFGWSQPEPEDAGQPPAQPAFGGFRCEMYPEMLAGMAQADAEDERRLGQPGGYPYASRAQPQLEAG
jgi:hypothetical protein